MTYNATKPSIYPPYCFDAAPTYNVSSFLTIADISTLQLYRNIPGVHFHRNLPIRWVRIVGVIVAIDDYPERRVYTIDDSSGLNIECVLSLEPRPENTSNVLAPGPLIHPEYSEFDVGHVADLRGPIVPYRRQKAIKIRRMNRVLTTQHELHLWERRLKFKMEALDAPWALSDEEIRAYRKKAERADATAAKRKRRAENESVKDAGGDDDPFKIRKCAAKPADARSHKSSHPSRESRDAAKTTSHEKPAPRSRSEIDPHRCGDETDPYDLKARKTTRPASSAAPRASSSRRLSVQDDPFRITKRGSKKPAKPPVQPSSQSSVESVSAGAPSSSDTSKSKSVSRANASSGSQASPKPSRKEKSAPTPKPRTQRATRVDTADDPYALKTRNSRRPLAKPTVPERNTPADPFKITRSRGGACSEKSPNAESRCSNKCNFALSAGKDSKHAGRVGAGMDDDDPFRIRKRVGK